MNFPELLYSFDLVGSFVFALSGALVGVRKRYNVTGIFVLSFLTAIAGGTLRSLLLGDTPVRFITDMIYLYMSSLATLVVYLLRGYIYRFTKLVKIFDAVGLGFFFTTGMTVSLQHHLGFIPSIVIGIITATGSGVLRELLSAEIPFIFRKELYVVICIIGGLVYFTLYLFPIPREYIFAITTLFIITLRFLAIEQNWMLNK